ncbi:hypothetical protein [Psychromonas ossibalaenae]|uniref:hypothetical protein n=1 Tax=Psychromonas ossibalaenae TaxID=444922 RepID=UPI00035E28EC|nr:hypothetical protein [Psychromonas ossibalaenae]
MDSHGYLDFKWFNDILYVKAFGPFNDEGSIEAAKAYIDVISNRSCVNYSVVEILTHESLGSPNTMKEVTKVWTFLGDNGCTSLAIIHSNAIQSTLAEKFIPKFGKVFNKLESAERWIGSRSA